MYKELQKGATAQWHSGLEAERFDGSTVRGYEASTVRRFDGQTIEQSNDRTIEQSNNRTIEQLKTIFTFVFYLLSFVFYLSSMECRPDCGACCIAISISSPIPGMNEGKPAGVRCIHLLDDYKCALYGDPSRPKVCSDYKAEPEFCGSSREEAFRILDSLT